MRRTPGFGKATGPMAFRTCRRFLLIKRGETVQSKDGRRQKKLPASSGGGRKQICVGGVGGQICYEMVGQTCYNREEAQLR
jgi:hypothetical protein